MVKVCKKLLKTKMFHILLGNPKSGFQNPNLDFPIECNLYVSQFDLQWKKFCLSS